MTQRKRRTFTPEQKSEAVRLVRELGNLSRVARDLDLSPSTLRRWVRQAESADAPKRSGDGAIDAGQGPEGALTTEEKAEMRRLRREIRTLRMERDFLKKAAAFFAKEGDQPSR